ncbi:FAD-binding oxidoreductase [Actinomadura viridis]|uniref:Glycolate oxidase FAD binding subunit n=1 Tax=Actinomadura viridis TaxID=58110 RepID=A0A931DFT6_9ACTN|nr:FAD-binding oxidoreductase [Actinomadura viridis]MBG6087999.1 glycolate oxidase FAD binding subunit [Actinomadura viridis]
MGGQALDALAKVCGDVRPGEPAEGVLGVVPGVVAAPASVAEAAEVMRVAAEESLAVVPRGAETRLDWGTPPLRCDLLLDTARLDRVVEHAAGDLVVTAEAGLGMDRLAEVLASRGQRLALDTPLPGSTVGGTIATAAAGPLRLLYGTPRDLVIGLTVVRADGRVARSGGKVVKNVAGYDLGRLFSGSYGTLGLIVEATFRLHPVPAARAFLTRAVPDAARAHEAVQAVLHSPAAPSAVECVTPAGNGGDGEAGGIVVGVLLEGVPEGVAARTGQLRALLGEDTAVAPDPPEWWGAYPDGTTLIDVTAPPSALAGLLAAAEAAGPGAALSWSAAGRGHVGLSGEAAPGDVARTLGRLRGLPDGPRRCAAVVRYAPEAVRAEVDPWGPVPALSLMRGVKDQFDPDHRMSPGRFVGGL